jgi:hypothetical protein
MRSDCSRLDGLSPGLGVFVCVCAGEGTDRVDVLRVGAWLWIYTRGVAVPWLVWNIAEVRSSRAADGAHRWFHVFV